MSSVDHTKSKARLKKELIVHVDAEALARSAAELVCHNLAARPDSSRLAVVLSGGSTPRRLYQLLASQRYRGRVPWERVHWFWGDERYVAPNSARSNFGLVKSTLLLSTAPKSNVHPIRTIGLTAQDSAVAYAGELNEFRIAAGWGDLDPLFDVVLLGLGDDGHIASLFPGSAALEERSVLATAAKSPEEERRITLTYPALESCRTCLVLVAGSSKAAILSAVGRGEDLPATRLAPHGECLWLVDRAAARM